jgi:hypothetical protein
MMRSIFGQEIRSTTLMFPESERNGKRRLEAILGRVEENRIRRSMGFPKTSVETREAFAQLRKNSLNSEVLNDIDKIIGYEEKLDELADLQERLSRNAGNN